MAVAAAKSGNGTVGPSIGGRRLPTRPLPHIQFDTIGICINKGSTKGKPKAVSLGRGCHRVPRRRVWHLPPDGFRELRWSCLLSRKACADLLGCSMSAVRAWDRGTHRVPWSAVKLLRLFRLGDLGTLRPEWRGWTINRNGLVSPEGFTYSRGDLGWWSLTCRQAECWRQDRERQRAAGRATGRSVPEPPSSHARSAAPLASRGNSVPAADRIPADRCGRTSPLIVGKAPRPPRLLAQRDPRSPRGVDAEGGKSARCGSTGLVSSQKQVERQGQKVRKDAASRGGVR